MSRSTSPAQHGVHIREPRSVTANLRAAPPSGAAGAGGRPRRCRRCPRQSRRVRRHPGTSPSPRHSVRVGRGRGFSCGCSTRVPPGSPGPQLRPRQFLSCPTWAARALTCSRLQFSPPSPGSIGDCAATAEPVVASTTPTTSAPTRAVQPRRTRPRRPATAARRACGRRQAREARQCPCRAWQLAGRTCRAEHTRPFPTVWRPQRTRKAYQLMIVGTLPSSPSLLLLLDGFPTRGPGRPGPSGTGTRFHCRALPMSHARLLLVGRRTDRDGELFPMGGADGRCSVLGRRAGPGSGTRSTP